MIDYNHSFASHAQSKCWSTKNLINPCDVYKHSNKLYLFDCDKCNHEFKISLNNLNAGRWCPYCSKPCKKLCNNLYCNICFDNSFYSNYNSVFWSNKNEIHPRYIIKSSKIKYWFDCHECNHVFEISLDNIINGRWCPYCSHNILCDIYDCIFCFNNSFASIDNSKYVISNDINLRMTFKFNKSKLCFKCNDCNSIFESSIHHVSGGSWCSCCKKKTELKLFKWLKNQYKSVLFQVKYIWCKNSKTDKCYIYDFEINNKILIELDGPQHFRQISNWRSPIIQNEIDKYKITKALENNKHIIHIYQEDVLYDRNNWNTKLEKIISKLLLLVNPSLFLIGINKNEFC